MRKKLGVFIIVASVVAVSFVGCTKSNQPSVPDITETTNIEEDMPDAGLTGGFDYTEAVGALSAEEEAIFEEAIAEFEGSVLEPLAVISEQLVAGTNYSFLCKSTTVTPGAVPELKLVVISTDLDGNASIYGFASFNINDLLSDSVVTEDEEVDGGWSFCENNVEATLPANVKAAFDKANNEYTGVNLTPKAYLGSQVVAGSNYLLLCQTETIAAEPVHGIALVKVYEDLNGNASIEDVCSISAIPEIE